MEQQLKNLHTKLQLLLKQNQLLHKNNNALQKENAALKALLETRDTSLAKMQQQIDIFKLSSNTLDQNEKLLLKKRIDMYLAEIDKCLTLLNE